MAERSHASESQTKSKGTTKRARFSLWKIEPVKCLASRFPLGDVADVHRAIVKLRANGSRLADPLGSADSKVRHALLARFHSSSLITLA